MKNHKKILCFAFPVAVVMALVLGLAFMNIGVGKDGLAKANSSIYVGSKGTCTISGGTISDDIDVAGGTLTLTGGTIKGNINLNGTMNLSSGATINGTVNLQNTSSYITLTSSLTRTITVKPSSTASGTRIAYAASASYLNTSRFSVTNLPSNMRIVVEGNYIVIRPNAFTVTVRASSGGTVNSTSSVTINNVAPGTQITVSGSTITIGGTTVTARADSGYEFSEWTYSDPNLATGQVVNGDMTIYANFKKTTISVYFTTDFGGTISPSRIDNVPAGSRITAQGNTITINGTTVTATPDAGYRFLRWEYSGDTVTSDKTIIAHFAFGDGSSSGGTASSDFSIGVENGIVLQPYDLALIMTYRYILTTEGSNEWDAEAIFPEFFEEATGIFNYYVNSVTFTNHIVTEWGPANGLYISYIDLSSKADLYASEFDMIFSMGYVRVEGGERFDIGSLHQLYNDGKDDIDYSRFLNALNGNANWLLPSYNISDFIVFTPNLIESFADLLGTEFCFMTIEGESERDTRIDQIISYLNDNGCDVEHINLPPGDDAYVFNKMEENIVSDKMTTYIFSESLLASLDLNTLAEEIQRANEGGCYYMAYYLGDIAGDEMCISAANTYHFVYINPGIFDKFGRDDISYPELIELLSHVFNQRYRLKEELEGYGIVFGEPY